MFMDSLQDFSRAGHSFDYVRAVAGGAFHLCDVATLQLVFARADLFARDAFAAQGFFDDLQICHARDDHLVQAPSRAEHRFKHRNCVVLEYSIARAAHQRAVEIPEENTKR